MQSSPIYSMEDLDKALPTVQPRILSAPTVLGAVRSPPTSDPFGTAPVDYKTKCLNVITEALRVVINYVHFSKRWPRIQFMCKKVDGKDATWHPTDPDSRSEGYDIYHLAKHISCGLNLKFYSSFLGISDFALGEYCNLFVALRNPLDHVPFLTSNSRDRDTAELMATKNAVKKAIDFLSLIIAGPEIKQIREIQIPLSTHLATLQSMLKNLGEYAMYRYRRQNLKHHLDENEPYCQRQVAHSILQQLSQKLSDPAVQNLLLYSVGPRINCSDDQVLDSWFSGTPENNGVPAAVDSYHASHLPPSPPHTTHASHVPADAASFVDVFQAHQPPRNTSPSHQSTTWDSRAPLFDSLGTKEWGNFSPRGSTSNSGIWSYDNL